MMIIAMRFWVEDMGLFPLKREAGLDMQILILAIGWIKLDDLLCFIWSLKENELSISV